MVEARAKMAEAVNPAIFMALLSTHLMLTSTLATVMVMSPGAKDLSTHAYQASPIALIPAQHFWLKIPFPHSVAQLPERVSWLPARAEK